MYRSCYAYLAMLLIVLSVTVEAQVLQRGDPTYRRNGVHNGNQVKTVFTNYGVIAQPGDQGNMAAWRNANNGYVGDISPLVGVTLPYRDYTGDGIIDTIPSVIITPVDRPGSGDWSPGKSQLYAFEPIPGFSNPEISTTTKGVAMSHQPETWPSYWPDQPTWVDSMGKALWNGYFGMGIKNADQESYFRMDDSRDEEMFHTYGFLPDSLDPTLKGHGLQVSVRGLQWSHILSQDVVFWIYKIHNIGTSTYPKAVFGTIIGTYVGGGGDEWMDDVSNFEIREALTYSYDFDDYIDPASNSGWEPDPHDVGYIGYAFLESPGNGYDGIDNDGDYQGTNADYFEEDDFSVRTIEAGDKLVLIDKYTYERSIYIMPDSAVTIYSLGKKYDLVPGETKLIEGNMIKTSRGVSINANAIDGFDNDLDGLIDENSQVHYRQYVEDASTGEIRLDDINPVKYIDFVNNSGEYLLIDEKRDDGIDNDGDWLLEFDDVGADGVPNTGDFGENDGLPTDGEPAFDRTDVDESDQIGLTSFQYFVPSSAITMSNEVDMWRRMRPGYFDFPQSIVDGVAIRGEDGDFIYGSGYFPLLPGKSENFSIALLFGEDYQRLKKTKRIVQMIYNANYNFPMPPDLPTVKATAGDGEVILYWDRVAESSIDRITKKNDFEGYKIIRGTDPDFTDAFVVTDAIGYKKTYKPIAQFDLNNGINGMFLPSGELHDLMGGLSFYLGNDTGIQNTFVDSSVTNGKTYYYAVVAYDRGDADNNIFPSENSKYIFVDVYGNITTDKNTVVVTPNAPVAGYIPPESGVLTQRISGASTVTPYYEVIDAERVKNATYEITFKDSISNNVSFAKTYSVRNVTSNEYVVIDDKLTRDNGLVYDGVRLSLNLDYQHIDSIKINNRVSGWNNENDHNFRYKAAVFNFPNLPQGYPEPHPYRIIFYDEYTKSTTDEIAGVKVKSISTNFEVYDYVDAENPVKLPFLFSSKDDTLNANERIILGNQDTSSFTWYIDFLADSIGSLTRYAAGDTLYLTMYKPLSGEDTFRFDVEKSGVDNDLAKQQMEDIRVVPNPYVVSNIYEEPLAPGYRGRGERVINFINLPAQCKISIYNSSGTFIRELYHDSALENGTVTWDVKTREGLDIAFGVYFYIVEAENIGEKKFGKIAIIK